MFCLFKNGQEKRLKNSLKEEVPVIFWFWDNIYIINLSRVIHSQSNTKTTLSRLIFTWIYFRGCKCYHISREFIFRSANFATFWHGFIFADREILIILRLFIFAVARHVMSSMTIVWKNIFFSKLPKIY